MRINIIFCILCVAIFTKTSTAQVNFGVGASVIAEDLAIGPQVRGAYPATEKIAFSGAFSYFFKKSSSFSIDLDAQFKIINIEETRISPFAGINIRERGSKVSTALQLGFFIQVPKDSYELYIEPKAILDEDTVFAISGGLYF
jgi:hypothetical protein